MRLVFLHGGPGFNSFAEAAILGPLFHSHGHVVTFWNEPSRLRPAGDAFEPDRAFEAWLASAERVVLQATAHDGPVHLAAHSLTIHAAVDIARRHPDRIASLVLIAPGADLFATFTNVLRLAQADLVDRQPAIAATIAACRARARRVLDAALHEGLLNTLHDDRLFTHYWSDPNQHRAATAAQARPEAQFDVESFFTVLADFGERGASLLDHGSIATPTLILFGDDDPVTSAPEQRQAVLTAVPQAQIEVFTGCSHYLHLDRPQQFLETVAAWALRAER